MRVVVVGPAHPFKGGPTQHATLLAHHLAEAGHCTTLESWREQYPKLLYPGQLTVSEPEVPLFPDTRRELSWRRPDGWFRIGARLGREADVVVIFVYTPVQVPAHLALVRGVRRGALGRRVRVVALCNNVLPHERRRIDEPLMRALLQRVDAVLVHSAEQAALAGTLTDCPIRVAPLPPHLPSEVAGAEPIPAPPEPHRRLLFFGIVRDYKGLDVLLRALAAGPPGVQLLVAGEFWGGTEEYDALVAELGLRDRVELRAGYVDAKDLPGLFARCDALVLPYRSATSSQNALIAFQFGLPVIATSAGALAERVSDGVDGIVCAPDDVAALAVALERFYSPGTPERLRTAVKPLAPGEGWAAYVSALLD